MYDLTAKLRFVLQCHPFCVTSFTKMKKKLRWGIFLFCFFILFFETKSFAFGNDLDEHCWTNSSGSVFIKHQVTQMGNLYNLNGIVTLSGIGLADGNHPTSGTAFYDIATGKIKVGYTVVQTINSVTVYLDLDPTTLDGIKTVFFHDGSSETEDVTYTSCKEKRE